MTAAHGWLRLQNSMMRYFKPADYAFKTRLALAKWQQRGSVIGYIVGFSKSYTACADLTPMRLFSIFSTVCNCLYRPGFARSNPRTYRQPSKLPNELVRCWRLQLLHIVTTNHTSIIFPLPFPLLLICARRWCPWSWVARTFLVRATIAAKLGIGLQSVSCQSNRSLPNQLPIGPTNRTANFKAVRASFQVCS